MRENKYRAWDSKFKKMYYSHGDNPRLNCFRGTWEIDLEGENGDTIGTVECDGDTYPLMQHTGLKDKNGVDIYEGDILRRINHYDDVEETIHVYLYHKVVWYNDQWFQAWNIVNDNPKTGNGNCALWVYKPHENSEVIGNIHENPELLTNETTP